MPQIVDRVQPAGPGSADSVLRAVVEKRCVCFGSSRSAPESDDAHRAHRCGAVIAGLGWTLMSGGYEGAMGAASRGASEAGGRVVGVTTPVFAARVPNPALDVHLVEPDYLARMATLLRQGHAFVGLPGGLGTMAEWLSAWCLASIGQLPGPLILFRDPWRPFVERITGLAEVGPTAAELVHWVDAPEDLRNALGTAAGPPSEPPAGG